MESENSKGVEDGGDGEQADVQENGKSKIKVDSENSSDYDESDDNDLNMQDLDSVSSDHSTTNPDVLHQRRKEKLLKKKLLSRAIENGNDGDDKSVAASDMTSKLEASVGTSKISNKSFRNINNLTRLQIINHPYKNYRLTKFDKERTSVNNLSSEEMKIDQLKEANKLKLLKQLAHKWRTIAYEASIQQNMKYEPTYRLEPKDKIRTGQIMSTCKNTLDRLVRKNNKYDPFYCAKFAKVATEMLKYDVKQFELDRYKIIVHLSILQKVVSQSYLMTSSCLWSAETDRRICIKSETDSFYAICYIFLIYHE
jgi:hypothetical protein